MEVVKAVILKTVNYSDTQRIVHTFTKERGYLSFISPSFLFKKKATAVTNMQIVEIEFFENEKSDLHKLKTISSLANTSDIYFDIYKMNIILLWSEILNLVLKKEQKNEDTFNFIARSVEYLNTSKEDTANFNLFFLYRLTALIGFSIDASGYSQGSVFNINDGSFVQLKDNTPHISGPNTAKAIYNLCTCRLEELKNIPLDRSSRAILLDILLLFLTIHLNIDFNIKSIKVIREVFSE